MFQDMSKDFDIKRIKRSNTSCSTGVGAHVHPFNEIFYLSSGECTSFIDHNIYKDREKQEWKAVEGVNVTLGLPIIHASVDHGTDFYHAGKGNGNELSLVNAIKYAVKMTGRAN